MSLHLLLFAEFPHSVLMFIKVSVSLFLVNSSRFTVFNSIFWETSHFGSFLVRRERTSYISFPITIGREAIIRKKVYLGM